MTKNIHLILGSSSRYRRNVILQHKFNSIAISNITLSSPDIDEKAIRNEIPKELAMEISRKKADAVIEKLIASKATEIWANRENENSIYILVTADQVTTFQGVLHEKPLNEEEAREWLKSYIENEDPIYLMAALTVQNITPLIHQLNTIDRNENLSKEEIIQILKECPRLTDVDITSIIYPVQPLNGIEEILKKDAYKDCCGAITIEDPSLKVELSGEINSVFGLPTILLENLILQII